MPVIDILRESSVKRTPRVLQLEGLFELPPTQKSEQRWAVEMPLDARAWQIGLIVGASGSGKSTVAREMFGENLIESFDWSESESVVDGFPQTLGVKEVTGLLSSVGFSSPPSWLRPFCTLSTGERFRATLARALAEERDLIVIDEFTSVVDRRVAQIGSAAVAKAVRRSDKQFVAVSCHEDVIDWLQPDWTYEPATNTFEWRCLQQRPEIKLEIRQVDRAAWKIFAHHHYLSTDISKSARCFLATVEGDPAVFTAVLSFPHPKSPGWREHRTVCLPDFQGVGLGNAMSEYIASLYAATGKPYRSVTSNPAMVRYRARSSLWRMFGGGMKRHAPSKKFAATTATRRLIASFEYVGPHNASDAESFGLLKNESRGPRRT